jgi:hypothetical protein
MIFWKLEPPIQTNIGTTKKGEFWIFFSRAIAGARTKSYQALKSPTKGYYRHQNPGYPMAYRMAKLRPDMGQGRCAKISNQNCFFYPLPLAHSLKRT